MTKRLKKRISIRSITLILNWSRLKRANRLLFMLSLKFCPRLNLVNIWVKGRAGRSGVDDIQVDHHLYHAREQNARLVPREEGQVKEGDSDD
jgi:hypothetical protein